MLLPKRLTAFFLCFLLLMGITGCDTESDAPTEVPPPEDTRSGTELYNAGCRPLLSAENRVMQYTFSKTRTIGSQSYTESAVGTASFSGLGTDAMVAVIDEALTYGTVKADHLLSFCNGTAYSRISESIFACDISRDDFMDKQLPAALLTPGLYGTVQKSATAEGTTIAFSNPTTLESWVPQPGARLVSVLGTATLDQAGVLTHTTYSASYTCGETNYLLEVSLRCSAPAQLDLSALHPEHPEDCPKLTCLEAPKILLQTVGDIFTAQSIRAQATETVYSEAIPVTRLRQIAADSTGMGDSLAASLSYGVEVTDYRGQVTASSQVYNFKDGLCTSALDGGEPKSEPGITAEVMRTSIEDTVLAALFATQYLAEAKSEEETDRCTLRFTGNEAYATDLCRDLGAYLDLNLDENATSYHSTQATGYLTIDKSTGLPVAMGMFFTRTHVFGEVPYVLHYQLDQTLDLK